MTLPSTPFVFNNKATDSDGDSLVYSLVNPLTGADTINPQPCPPSSPPYNNVSYINPPYSVNNMLNGTTGGIPLSINPQTGLLTAYPNTIYHIWDSKKLNYVEFILNWRIGEDKLNIREEIEE